MENQNTQLTPDVFKQKVMSAHPEYENAVASDGTPYKNMDALDFTKRASQNFPDAVTSDGHKYSDYLPKETPQSASDENKPGFVQSTLQSIVKPFATIGRTPVGLVEQGIGALTGSEALKKQGAELAGRSPIDLGYLGKVGQAGFDEQGQPLSTGGAIAQGAGIGAQIAPYFMGGGEVSDLIKNAGQKTVGGLIKSGVKTGAFAGGAAGAGQAIQAGTESGKDTANIGSEALIQGAGGLAAGAIGGGLIEGIGGLVGKLTGKLGNDLPFLNAVDALNPDATGKKLTSQYEKGALQGRVQPGSAFSPQGVAPDQEVLRLGKSLSDIGLKPEEKEAANNLVKLGNALKETETKIAPFNSYGVEPGVKTVLSNELEGLKARAPREFSGIKESQSMFNNVVDFGKEVVANAKSTIGGYRDARIKFDKQAKLEFPGAYDDNGFINTKTPAGQAIKAVRDTLNKNLYDIAPTKSNLQQMIQREADIYQAARNIAPKAKQFHGLTGWEKTKKLNPGLMGALKLGAEVGGVGTAAGLVGRYIGGSNTSQ